MGSVRERSESAGACSSFILERSSFILEDIADGTAEMVATRQKNGQREGFHWYSRLTKICLTAADAIIEAINVGPTR